MKASFKILFLFIGSLLFCKNTKAQSIFYQHDTSIKVIAYGQQQKLAWCGGFDSPQFSMADLNHDGLQDLVVFDNWVGVRTFINLGSPSNPNYRYAPEYALNFPPIYDFLTLADYNCDGIADLFHRGGTGYEVYKGYYNTLNQLCFTFKQDLFYNNVTTIGPINAYVNPGDIPAVVDVDGDGDLDFISYEVNGRTLYWYRNMRVEYGLPCDSLLIHLEDKCWGKVLQQYYRTHILNYECPEDGIILPKHQKPGEKTTHAGNTPCLFDWDMDGDIDYLDGSVSFNNMTFLRNGKSDLMVSIDSMVYQDTMWQEATGGKIVDIATWPAAFNIDIDQDGKKDLLISPNAQGTENYKCVWYYKNLSTPGSPNWQFESDTFLIDQTIDVGSASYPMLYDYDKDGKLDLFVGSDGYYQSTGLLKSRISYYKNTSVAGSPSFTLQTNDFMGLSAQNFAGAAPTFGDIDGDGKDDMILGHTDGTMSYYTNIASSGSVQPIWQLAQTVLADFATAPINVGGKAAPFIYDVDHDGKPDLVIGSMYGDFQYYKNINSVPGTIKLRLSKLQLGNITVDPLISFPNCSTPFIGKIDSTGTDYLMSGSNSGNIYKIGGIASGDTNATYTILDGNFSYIDSQFLYYNHMGEIYGVYQNLRTSLTIGDIVGDGGSEMIVGNTRGGLDLYRLKVYYPEDSGNRTTGNEQGHINVFPNPANSILNITWTNLKSETVEIKILNMEGQQISRTSLPTSYASTYLPVSELPKGMYICMVVSGTNRYYNKFTVLR